MKCSCPKCHAQIEFPIADVTESGTPAQCPLCSGQVVVHRESFGARVYRMAGEISCADCGEILGPQTYCASCGTNFPDYFVVSPGSKPIRKVKKVKLGSSPFSRQFSINFSLPKLQPTAARDAKPTPQPLPGKKRPPLSKPLVWGISGAVVVALVAGGVFYYLSRKAATEYTDNFLKATYCIQTAAENGLKSCSQLVADPKTGQPANPKLSAEEERNLRVLKSRIDVRMEKMKNPPKKYAPVNDKLGRLYTSYLKVNGLALNPPPVNILPDAIGKAENDYKVAAKDFKSGLPQDLAEELREASKRHPNLKALVD